MTKGKIRFIWHILFWIFFSLGGLYFFICLVLFHLFAPAEISILGIDTQLITLDDPVKISLVLIIISLLFKSTMPRSEKSRFLTALTLLFCIIFLIHISSGVITSFDSRWVIPTAYSLIKEGNANLDEYESLINEVDYRIEKINGHFYSIFPIGVPFLSAPFTIFVPNAVIEKYYGDMEKSIASLFVAMTAVFIFLMSYFTTKNIKQAFILSCIFAFCTSAWSVASRALWQHGPSMLMLSLVLFLIVRSKRKPALIQFIGLPLSFSYAIRPTNILSVFVFTLFVFLNYRKYFIRYVFWTLPVVISFILYNVFIYHSLLPPYYWPKSISSFPILLQALAGHLISPSRGLFIYSPVLIFSLWAVCKKIKQNTMNRLDYSVLGIIFLHWILISSYPHWWGGHSFGPRLFADMIPFFCYFLIPVLSEFQKLAQARVFIRASLFILLAVFSFLIHFRGSTSYAGYKWNVYPMDIDKKSDRIWDWHDPQFLRGIFTPPPYKNQERS